MTIFQTIDGVNYELVPHQDGTQALYLNGKLFATKESANAFILNKAEPSKDVIIVNGTEKVAEGSFTKDGAIVDGLIYDVVTDDEGTKTLFLRDTKEVHAIHSRWWEPQSPEEVVITDGADTNAGADADGTDNPQVDGSDGKTVTDPTGTHGDTKPEPTEPSATVTDGDTNSVVDEPAAPAPGDEIPADKGVDCPDPSEPQQKDQTSLDHQESESPGGSLAPAVFVPVIVSAATIVGLGSFVAHRHFMNKKALRAKNSQRSKASKN